MNNQTRLQLNTYMARLAQLNAVASVVQQFNVAPAVQQTLEAKTQESSEFLQLINLVGVDQQMGAKIGIGVSGPTASRTDTTGNAARQPRDVSNTEGRGYTCLQTNFDTAFPYPLLDAWAHKPDFQILLRNAIVRQQALDRITIGWNGRQAAATTDLQANPLLQDVNIGWLQHIREDAPTRTMKGGGLDENAIYLPAAGEAFDPTGHDYDSLDQLVFDAVHTLLDPWHRQNPKLVAIVGGNLMHDKLFPLASGAQAPTEQLAADIVRSQRRLGGLQAVTVPFFPDNTVLVTTLANLSIYWQIGARRRYIKDAPEKNRIENYESSNDAYVVEDFGCSALIESITLGAAPEGGA